MTQDCVKRFHNTWKAFRNSGFGFPRYKYTSQICPECNAHTGKKELSARQHNCSECGYSTTRDHASARVILNRGLENIVPMDNRERKLSAECVLPGVAISRQVQRRKLSA